MITRAFPVYLRDRATPHTFFFDGPPALMDQDQNIVLFEHIHADADPALAMVPARIHRVCGALAADTDPDLLADATVIGIRSKSRVDRAALDRMPNLTAIGCFCIGVNQVDLAEAMRRGIVVFNAPFSNTRSVAELTIAEIIALNRQLMDKCMQMHAGHWDKRAPTAHEVRGQTVGIVGYGHIGAQVSVLAEALGLRVIYYDITPKLPLGNARACVSLSDLLGEADIVTLHVPATPLTQGMFGPREFAQMKRGAMLINNSRGSVVDLEACAQSMRKGHIGGAAFDVYPEEPSDNGCPFACTLAGLPNVMLTPHIGGSTGEAQRNIALEVADKLARCLRTGTTTGAVNVPQVDLPVPDRDQYRILHFHRNVPGVLSKLHGVLAERSVNINAEYLQSNSEISYVILDVDPHDAPRVMEDIAAIPETIRIRFLLPARRPTAPAAPAAAPVH